MLRYLLHPIRSLRRLRDLEDRIEELETTLSRDHQWLAHDPVSRELTMRYLALARDGWASYAPKDIYALRNELGLHPYRQPGDDQ